MWKTDGGTVLLLMLRLAVLLQLFMLLLHLLSHFVDVLPQHSQSVDVSSGS